VHDKVDCCIEFTFVPNDVSLDCVEDLRPGDALGDRADLFPGATTGIATADDTCGFSEVTYYDTPSDWAESSSACGVSIVRTWVATSRCNDVISIAQTISLECKLNCGDNGYPADDCSHCVCYPPFAGEYCEKALDYCAVDESLEDHISHSRPSRK